MTTEKQHIKIFFYLTLSFLFCGFSIIICHGNPTNVYTYDPNKVTQSTVIDSSKSVSQQVEMTSKRIKAEKNKLWDEAVRWQKKIIDWEKASDGTASNNSLYHLAVLLHLSESYGEEAVILRQLVESSEFIDPVYIYKLSEAYILAGKINESRQVWYTAFQKAETIYLTTLRQTKKGSVIFIKPQDEKLPEDPNRAVIIKYSWPRKIIDIKDVSKIKELRKIGYISCEN